MKHLPYLLFASAIVCGCGGDSGTVNTPAGTELRATDFLMPKQAGSQTMFRVWHFVTDTNGVRDTAFGGTISYIMADSAFRFSPTITATLILIGGSDSAGVKLPGYDSLYVFTDGGQLRISTYHGDSVGRRLIAEPIRAGATFRRGNDTTTANIVTIEHINTPVQTPIRTFSAVKTKRKFLSETV